MADKKIVYTLEFKSNSKEVIDKTKKSTKDLGKTLDNTSKKTSKLSGGLKKMFAFAGVAAGAVVIKKVFKDLISSTQVLGDRWAKNTKGMSFAYDNFLKTIQSGDWSNFFSNMEDAYKAGMKYAQMLDELFEKGNELQISQAKTNLLIAEQEIIVKDVTKADEERLSASNKIYEAQNEQLIKNQKVAKDTYDAEIHRITSLTGLQEAEFKVFVERYTKDKSIREDAIRLSELQVKANEQIVVSQTMVGDQLIQQYGPNKAAIEALRFYKEGLGKTGEAVQVYSKILEKYGKTTDDIVKTTVDAYTNMIDVGTKFFVDSKKNEIERAKLEEKLRKEKEAKRLKAIADREASTKKEYEDALKAFDEMQKLALLEIENTKINETEISIVKNDAAILRLQFLKDNALNVSETQQLIWDQEIIALKAQNAKLLEVEIQAAIDKKAALRETGQNALIAGLNADAEALQMSVDETERLEQERTSIIEDEYDKRNALLSEFSSIASNITSAAMNRELKMAGDNEEEKIDIRRKYAIIDKGIAVGEIAIATALGIAKATALAAANPLLLPALPGQIALMVATAAAQTAAIVATPLAGGGLAKGPLHAQGGIPYGGNEIEGNEYIVNRASTAAFFPLIDAINSAGNSQGRTQDVSGVDIIDYDKLASLINDKKVYVTTKDLNESLDSDADLKVQNTL